MGSRAGRAARGWVAAAVATTLAAVSHGLADGAFPSLFGFGASLLLAGSAGTLLTARTRSSWRLAVTVGISQVLFHGVFASLGTPTAAVAHHAAHTLPAAASPPVHEHGTMWIAHAVAAVVTFALLAHAESGAHAIVRGMRLLAGRLLRWIAAPTARLPRVIPAHASARRAPRLLRDFSPLRYRGPPIALRVA